MSTEIELLEAERKRLREEFQRVGKPILDQAVEVGKQIMNLKREAGLLFYVDYMRYHSKYTEDCETFAEAKGFATALTDNGEGYVKGIRGPGVDLDESEWEDYEERDTLSEQP